MNNTLIAVTCCLMVSCAIGQTPTTKPLSAGEELELKTLTGQLGDPSRAANTKVEAAELLLTKTYAQATGALKDFLADNTNRSAQLAVAEAIARHGSDQRAFVEPLVTLLTGSEPSVRAPAAKALAACKSTSGASAQLVAVASDKKRDRSIRIVAIISLQRVLDKQVVDSLVRLLDDNDAAVRDAASDSLSRLTNIRDFGASRSQWKSWWQQNKDKDRAEWLADLAESLGQTKSALELDNARLRTRLAKTMIDLFTATPAAQREPMLMSFLKDPLEDVRLVGLDLLSRSLDSGAPVSQDLRQLVRALLIDSDEHVRQESARLVAVLGDAEALAVLLARLKSETTPGVRQGILMALGYLHDPKALPAILAEIDSKSEDVAAAAAMALTKIASKQALQGPLRQQAVDALTARYRTANPAGGESALREALLAAMGDVGDKSFLPVLQAALKDEAAMVRLAAVNSLVLLNDAAAVTAMEGLVGDSDRGVRGAAIAALRSLGGAKYLQVILQRTDPTVEDDAANRQQAWDLVMAILAKCDAKVLTDIAAKLADRADATAQRIKILQMLVSMAKESKSSDLPAVLREMGLVLAKNARHAEAAPYLADAYTLLAAGKDEQAPAVWLEWVEALLSADDPAAIKTIADQSQDESYNQAIACLNRRLAQLEKKENWQGVIAMTRECCKQLPTRLSDDQRKQYQQMIQTATSRQLAADHQRVAKLVPQLTSADESARKAALAELQAMGDRGAAPLIQELKTCLEAETPNAVLEQSIVDALRQVAPKLAGYDPATPKDQRLKLIATWLK